MSYRIALGAARQLVRSPAELPGGRSLLSVDPARDPTPPPPDPIRPPAMTAPITAMPSTAVATTTQTQTVSPRTQTTVLATPGSGSALELEQFRAQCKYAGIPEERITQCVDMLKSGMAISDIIPLLKKPPVDAMAPPPTGTKGGAGSTGTRTTGVSLEPLPGKGEGALRIRPYAAPRPAAGLSMGKIAIIAGAGLAAVYMFTRRKK